MSPTSRTAVLISNPGAGRVRQARSVRRIVEVLARGGWETEALITRAPGHATELARAAARGGAVAVFAYGGDGTLRETAAGLLGTNVPVGFLPGGTANVMALTLGLPRDPLRAAAWLASAGVREIDVGLCGDEVFLMQASCGLDARVIAGLRSRGKRRLGRLGVALAAVRHAFTYRYPPIEIAADGRRLAGSFAAVCNIPYYGGPWRLVPQARPDDRKLDLLVFRGAGLAATTGFSRDLFLGRRHLFRDDVETLQVDQVRLLPGDAPIQIDGDAHPGRLPLSVRLSELRLRILAPRGG